MRPIAFAPVFASFVALALAAFNAVYGESEPAPGSAANVAAESRWTTRQSKNFRIWTTSNLIPDDLPASCEELKSQIESAWPFEGRGAWTCPCDIVIHATRGHYQRAVGISVGESVGCATMKFKNGCVVSRRIDIRADADNWRIDALPHELTHVVLADRLGNVDVPPWLDEGISVLSESNAKRQARVTAFQHSHKRRTVYSISDLVRLRTFPKSEYRDAFYVQSAALVRWLVERSGKEKFAEFMGRLRFGEIETALKQTYGIASLTELERLAHDADVAQLVSDGGTLPQRVMSVAATDPEGARDNERGIE